MAVDIVAENTISVGLGEIQVSDNPDVILACYGLGSCIGISAFDPIVKIGAMVHIVLPVSNNGISESMPAKFANTGIPHMLEEMLRVGAQKERLIIKVAGGARMLPVVEEGSLLDIGFRNVNAVLELLNIHKLKIHGEDIRGTRGRSLWLHINSGQTRVRSSSGKIVDL